MKPRIVGSLVALVVLLLLLFGCGKKVGDFSIFVSSGGLFVDQNRSSSVSIGVTRSEGFTKEITFSLTGAPEGVKANFTPNPLVGDTCVLTLTAAKSAPVGTYPVNIVGSSGSLRSTISLKLTIVLGTNSDTGVEYVFRVSGADKMDQDQLDPTMDEIIATIKQRISSYGITDVELKTMGTGQIEVKVLGELDDAERQRIRRLLGTTGQIEFLRVVKRGESPYDANVIPTSLTQEVLYDRDGIPYVLESQPLLTSSHISNAAVVQLTGGAPAIRLAFTKDGAMLFSKLVDEFLVNDCIAIVIDNVVYSVRCITQSLKAAAKAGWENVQSCTVISNGFNADDAKLLALIIRNGAFPVPVLIVSDISF